MSRELPEADGGTVGATPEPALVVLANRLPVVRTRGGWRAAAGGLVTALRPALGARRARWVGWDGGAADVPRRLDEPAIDLYPVALGRVQARDYYHGFANRTLWPLFHELIETPVLERRWWRAYRDVNARFAEAAAEASTASGPGTPLWVHDYHLLLVPGLLRALAPGGPVGFFLHTPFPAPGLFARLPWRAELLRGLLGAGVVAFHTDEYRRNFVASCARLLPEARADGGRVLLDCGRAVETAAHPISVDAASLAESALGRPVERELERLRRQFAGRQVLLGVDRLDYTKGILERLRAVELLLEEREDLRPRVAFVQIAVPSREEVREYRDLRREVEQLVGRINGRFTEPGRDVPVHYLYRGIGQERLLAYYRLADAALVTPLKDGMNLVAKEFVVCQDAAGGAGALVLSEFTGAADELRDALLCNPFDLEGLARQTAEALELGEAERRRRLAAMAAAVRGYDVFRWADDELAALAAAGGAVPPAGEGTERAR